jgi:hypothetical protein
MKFQPLFCGVAVCLLALSFSIQAAEKSGVRVIDSFDVGENVYVRALKVEKSADSLWVGTSVGALEIDLKTSKPRNCPPSLRSCACVCARPRCNNLF